MFSYENTSYMFSATSLNQKRRYESSLFHSMHVHGCTVAHWPSNLIRATPPQSRTIAVSLILNEECLPTVNLLPSFDYRVQKSGSTSAVIMQLKSENGMALNIKFKHPQQIARTCPTKNWQACHIAKCEFNSVICA